MKLLHLSKNLGNHLDILEYKLKFHCKVSGFFSIVCFFNNIDFDFDDYCNNTLKKLGANRLTYKFPCLNRVKTIKTNKSITDNIFNFNNFICFSLNY